MSANKKRKKLSANQKQQISDIVEGLKTFKTVISKDKGKLMPIEFGKTIPFKVKRFFVVSDVPKGVSRGGHAHKENKQVLVCLKGKIKLTVDNGYTTHTFQLGASESYFHPNWEWVEIEYVDADSIMMSFCSHEYDKDDYISDYKQFKAVAGQSEEKQTFLIASSTCSFLF